jgi:hypothetical protein
MTTSVFESYVALTEQDPHTVPSMSLEERALLLEDRVAVHTSLFHAMESRIGPDGLTEAHRPLIPLYQRWMAAARQLVVQAREFRAAGRPLANLDPLGFAINAAKNVADDFDWTVDLNARIRRGEPPEPGRPLE